MRLPKSKKEKIIWYLIIPFTAFAISGIFLYQIGMLSDIIGLLAWILIMPLWIGLLGLGADELIRKSDLSIPFFPIKNHTKAGVASVVLPITAIVIIIFRQIIPDIFKNNVAGSTIYNTLIALGTLSIFLGLIAVLGKNKDKYGLIGIILAITVSLLNFVVFLL
ncbi:MAG: hypothetical protein JW771_04410 [Candidatus Thermoplasmatota archaeon]|nr:hypothetical protein [Candidatus Thermoplasmatota archaeon]